MMVFLQPQIVFEDPNLLSELDNKIQKLTLKHDKNDKRSDIRNLLPEKFSEHNIEFSDLAEIATTTLTDKQLYIDYCHLSPTGANVLANRMANPVSEKVVSMIAGATVE